MQIVFIPDEEELKHIRTSDPESGVADVISAGLRGIMTALEKDKDFKSLKYSEASFKVIVEVKIKSNDETSENKEG